MHRAKIVCGHLTQCLAAARPNSVQRAECKSFPQASPDDIVVVHGLRTVIGKAKRGAFKEHGGAHVPAFPGDVSSRLMDNEKAQDCLIPMGAGKAQKLGLFTQEIVPVSTKFLDSEGNETRITVTQEDGIRAGTTLEGLAKLRPAFKENGSTTAGNASQVSDGAAAVLVAGRSAAQQLGLPVLRVLRASAVVGVPPDVMGIGPVYAIPIALQLSFHRIQSKMTSGSLGGGGLTVDDIDVFEINEAFASQALYCAEKLGIPLDKLNPSGGAIALWHPLGCTGARQVVTLLNELKRRGRRAYGVVSMCIGTGMGAAAVFEYPGQSNLQKV